VIAVGANVHRYDLDGAYDVGIVLRIEDGWVVVDFYDWIERWPQEKLVSHRLYSHGYDVLVPSGDGEVIARFHPNYGGP
jgi:hypothetical protein